MTAGDQQLAAGGHEFLQRRKMLVDRCDRYVGPASDVAPRGAEDSLLSMQGEGRFGNAPPGLLYVGSAAIHAVASGTQVPMGLGVQFIHTVYPINLQAQIGQDFYHTRRLERCFASEQAGLAADRKRVSDRDRCATLSPAAAAEDAEQEVRSGKAAEAGRQRSASGRAIHRLEERPKGSDAARVAVTSSRPSGWICCLRRPRATVRPGGGQHVALPGSFGFSVAIRARRPAGTSSPQRGFTGQ
jgi:hypothetical protein